MTNPTPARPVQSETPPPALLAAGALAAAGCTGGGGGDSGNPSDGGSASLGEIPAARFLAQAATGASRADIGRLQSLGFSGWLDEQFALPRGTRRFDWMVNQGYVDNGRTVQSGVDDALWQSLIGEEDTLRQRVAFALSEIFVVNIAQSGAWKNFAAAAFFDLLLDNAFGNFRILLGQVSTSVKMGRYLTFINNKKADPATGTLPDENYAREILQLFTIGLYQLNTDGTVKTSNGKPIETYTQSDILGLARVFTGWRMDGTSDDVESVRRPMVQYASWHETGAKTFLGTTLPAGTNGADSLRLALDAIFAHPNVPPFISKQLIQRLVSSNPSPAYVARVATIFANDGNGVRGNLQAVIRAILQDDEARNLQNNTAGKIREPILRFTHWARALGAYSPSGTWNIPQTSDPGTRLGQSPLRSPSVFNFFRPGYVPPNTPIAQASLVSPEFQIVEEVAIAGYINFMQSAVRNGLTDLKTNYTDLLPLATNASALVDELNIVLAAGALSQSTRTTLTTAISSISATTDTGKLNRIRAAVLLVLACPEFIVLK